MGIGSLINFFTIGTPPQNTGVAAGKNVPLSGGVGGGLPPFVEIMLGKIQQMQTQQAEDQKNGASALFTPPTPKGPLQSTNPLLEAKPTLDLVRVLSATPEIDQAARANPAPNLQILDTIALNQKTTDDAFFNPVFATSPAVDSLTIATPPGSEIGDIKDIFFLETRNARGDTTAVLQRLLGRLNKLSDDGAPQLITTNLTPEQITELKAKIEEYLERQKEKLAAGEDAIPDDGKKDGKNAKNKDEIPPIILANGVIEIVPVPVTTKPDAGTATTPINPDMVLAAALNGMVVGDDGETPLPFGATRIERPATQDMRAFSDALANASPKNATPDINIIKPSALNIMPPVLGQGTPADFFVMNDGHPLTLDDIQSALSSLGFSPSVSTPAANIITQAAQAGAPHPATQLIAATIQKNTTAGQDRTIILNLDPPELGRVEIRMNFGKDKAIKTVITAERPETYLMLQRDSQALERTMQDLNLDNGGLSFELAHEGYDFNHNGRHDGSHGGASGHGGDDNESLETIESTMTWHVDNATGYVRYNILA